MLASKTEVARIETLQNYNAGRQQLRHQGAV